MTRKNAAVFCFMLAICVRGPLVQADTASSPNAEHIQYEYGAPAIEPGHEADFSRAIELPKDPWLQAHPYVVESIQIEQQSVHVLLESQTHDDVALTLEHPDKRCEPGVLAGHFRICHPDGPQAARLAQLLQGSVSALPDGIWVNPKSQVSHIHKQQASTGTIGWYFLTAVLLILLLPVLVVTLMRNGWNLTGYQFRALLPVLIIAAASRWLFANWGIGEVFLNVEQLFMPGCSEMEFGFTPYLIYSALFWVLPKSFDIILGTVFVLSLLSVALFYLFLWELTKNLRLAISGALAISLMPVLVRYGGEANRQTMVLFFALMSFWALARLFRTRSYWDSALVVLAAMGCAGTRPEAGVVIGFLGILALVQRYETRKSRWISWGTILLLCLLGAVYWFDFVDTGERWNTDVHLSYHDLRWDNFGPRVNAWLNLQLVPSTFVLLGGVGTLFGLLRRNRLVLWALLSQTIHILVVAQWPVGVELVNLVSLRYYTLSFVLFAVVVAHGCDFLFGVSSRVHRFAAAALALILVLVTGFSAFVPPKPAALKATTADAEFHMLREAIQDLPQNAVVYTIPANVSTMVLIPPAFLSQSDDREDVIWRWFPNEWVQSDRPAFLWFNAGCVYAAPQGSLVSGRAKLEHPDLDGSCRFIRPALKEPLVEETILMRPFIAVGQSFGQMTVGLYALDNEKASELVDKLGTIDF